MAFLNNFQHRLADIRSSNPTRNLRVLSPDLPDGAMESLRVQIVQDVKMQLSPAFTKLQEEILFLGEEIAMLREASKIFAQETSSETTYMPRVEFQQAFAQGIAAPRQPESASRAQQYAWNAKVEEEARLLGSSGVHQEELQEPPEETQYRQILKNATDKHEFGYNAWNAATFSLVRFRCQLASAPFTWRSVQAHAVIMSILTLNIILQGSLLYLLWINMLLPHTKRLQQTYEMYHRLAFTRGSFDIQAFDSLGEKRDRVCQMAISAKPFLAICLFLWISMCFGELREILRSARQLYSLPTLPSGISKRRMLHATELSTTTSYEREMIVCLDHSQRALLYVLITVPRGIIAIALLITGGVYLLVSDSFEDVILNCVALNFVANVDELLCQTFLPERLRQKLTETSIALPDRGHTVQTNRQRMYSRTAVAMALACFIVLGLLYVQQVIPGYENDVSVHCRAYLETTRNVPCRPFDTNCFPKSRL